MPYGFVVVFWALALAVDPAYVGRCNELVLLSIHHVSGGVLKDDISALTNPNFAPPSEVGYLREDDVVMGLFISSDPRVYSHKTFTTASAIYRSWSRYVR